MLHWLACATPETTGSTPAVARDLRVLECPMAQCYAVLQAEAAALRECYGYDLGWPDSTPPEVVVACQFAPECRFVVGRSWLYRADLCGCYDRAQFDVVPPECCSEPLPDDAFYHLGDALSEKLEADCGVALEPAPMACELATPPEDRGDCGAD